jgi:acetylornithine deacetylase/succinyl-diaminopimelate desuccinylase-like protein
MNSSVAHFKTWYEKNISQIYADYFTFLRFPSISTDPTYSNDIRKTADWLVSYLKQFGMEAELWQTEGHPVVFASYLEAGPDCPTVLIYQHYDVQPVDPLDLWISDPFEPTIRNERVYARGASDNKGQCFYSITAIKAFLEMGKSLNINIKLFIEGEEECGSKGPSNILEAKKEALKSDYLLIVDLGLPNASTPAVTLGHRGIVAMEVTCKNSSIDLHSGLLGGIALNPNRALVQLLSKLWDDKGRVRVPAFYDQIETPNAEELKHIDQKLDLKELESTFGVKAFQGEEDYTLWESNTIRPTLEINGIEGGYTGLGFKTVIPAVAKAKISCRLVPNQDPSPRFSATGHRG